MLRLSFCFLASMGFSNAALAYCSEPTAPYCATGYSDFEDQDDFQSCLREMENYESEVETFSSCRRRELDSKIDDLQSEYRSKVDDETNTAKREIDSVVSAYNDAVSNFNSRSR